MSKQLQSSNLVRSFAGLAAASIALATWGAYAAAAGGGTLSGTVTLAGAGRVDNVVVSIEGLRYPATNGNTPAPVDLVLDQKDLTFVPHVLPVPAGVAVTFQNQDSVLHNVQSASSVAQPFNFVMMKGRSRSVTFDHEQVVPVHCNVHSEMSAYIVVKDNPFYAKPDKRGHFTIAGVPAGTYTVRAWDEHAGTADQRVSVAAGSTATVNFTLGK